MRVAAAAVSGETLPQTAAAPFALPEYGAPGGLATSIRTESFRDAEENFRERVDLQAAATAASASSRTVAAPSKPISRAHPIHEAAAFVLPGELLSKYGAAPENTSPAKTADAAVQSTSPVNYTPPRPKTLVETVEGWDGGSVLPGESLSRYNAPTAPTSPVGLDQISAESTPVTEQAVVNEAFSRSQVSLEVSGEAAPATSEEAGPSLSADPEAAVEAAVALDDAQAPEMVTEALPGTTAAEPLTTSAKPIDTLEQNSAAILESEGEKAEYEPEDGEASVRLSPPTIQELRLSQLFGGSEAPSRVQQAEAAVPETVQEPETHYASIPTVETEEGLRSTLHAGAEIGKVVEPGEQTADHSSALPESYSAAEERPEYPETHPVKEPESTAPVPEDAQAEPSENRAAVALEEFVHLQGVAAPHGNDGFTELVDQLHGFAPGLGLLEEEVIDEEEYDFDPIHAHADEHDLEDLEEETLDGGQHDSRFREDEEQDSLALRMEDASGAEESESAPEREQFEDEEDDPAAFALEEIDGEDEEDAATNTASGEPRRSSGSGERSGEDRGRRGGRNGRRRGPGGLGGGGGRRQSAQTQDLPIISDLLKQGQEILVQIAKEPIAKKGARITSHIALPGRFLVFMPTVSHVGVSRKIASDEERQRLKRILINEKGENSGGFIVRTAAEGASEEELRADLRFLISLWTEIKQRSETAKAPALIYHDLNLVERVLRDQVSSNFSTIWVDTEQEYERIVRFLNRFQPSLVRRVKLYTKETPLFEHFAIQEEISKALKSKVWLKSGGSIVINQTEALVAIDINTGKYVGKTARLEDTIVKTNLDAIPEIVRQIRLRDLGGIIVIDFIDMDERKNRHRVLAALEEAMKADRAPSKVLQFNDFGLVAITRKRVKQSLERTLSVQCETCAGTGMVKSPITVCNEIYIELRKMQKHLDGKDVMLRVHPEVVKQLKSGNGRWINEYEEMVGKTVIIKSDPSLHPEQFDIH